jgi:hypothetical protein
MQTPRVPPVPRLHRDCKKWIEIERENFEAGVDMIQETKTFARLFKKKVIDTPAPQWKTMGHHIQQAAMDKMVFYRSMQAKAPLSRL